MVPRPRSPVLDPRSSTHDWRHRPRLARQHLRSGSRAAREASRRLRRAVPRPQLPGSRQRRDAHPRLRRRRAGHGDLHAAGIRERRPPRDDEAHSSGDRSCRPGAAPMNPQTMRPIRETISLAEALALILDAATPIARTERIPLPEADGRVIATPPAASMDVPPFAPAAMAGYAVTAEDPSRPSR